jgi:hypothetical protein
MSASMMNHALNELFNDLGDLGDDGDRLRAAIAALENEATGNPNARAFLAAVCWIAEQPPSPAEKITAMAELSSLRGRHSSLIHINSLREFCGWRSCDAKCKANA